MCAFWQTLQNVLSTYNHFNKRPQGQSFYCYDHDSARLQQRKFILVFAAKVPNDPAAHILTMDRIAPGKWAVFLRWDSIVPIPAPQSGQFLGD